VLVSFIIEYLTERIIKLKWIYRLDLRLIKCILFERYEQTNIYYINSVAFHLSNLESAKMKASVNIHLLLLILRIDSLFGFNHDPRMECQECLNEMEGLGQLIKMGAGAIEVLKFMDYCI